MPTSKESKTIFSSDITPSEYGNKAHWLSWLARTGYNVPYAVLLPAVEPRSGHLRGHLREQKFPNLRELLQPLKASDGRYHVAVRSSATCEDLEEQSLAGHFLTVLDRMTYEEVLNSITRVRQSLNDFPQRGSCRMGVIIQELIDATHSGVIFSSNPLSGAKNEAVVGVVKGSGDELVSGQVPGEDIVLAYDEGLYIPKYDAEVPQRSIRQLWEYAKEIEQIWERPVDIEWCIDQGGNLYLLQCRPATGILSHTADVTKISLTNIDLIPSVVRESDKVSLRLKAERKDIDISTAFLLSASCSRLGELRPDIDTIQPSTNCVGYSVVLIHPVTVRGKVIREFTSCEAVWDTIGHVLNKGCDLFWEVVAIVQEVFDPVYSGIVKRINDNFVVEVTRGHFLPKGIVAFSRYMLDHDGRVIHREEVQQNEQLRIIGGQVRDETVPKHLTKVSLTDKTLTTIIDRFSSLLGSETKVIEFGLLWPDDNQKPLHPYLIDTVDVSKPSHISPDDIASGVVSRGQIEGTLIQLDLDEFSTKSWDTHFHDKVSPAPQSTENTIFLCERPHIALLEVLERYNPENVGFIFKQASILSHLPIVLRERGIPAIQLDDWRELESGHMVAIDASNSYATGRERVEIL